MSRPRPTIILEDIDESDRGFWVCEADAVYAVCYQNRPITVKTQANVYVNYPGPKYAKTSFPSAAHAFNLAERLNKRFGCEDFTVVMMTVGRTIKEK
jgi:hypothetical protein